MKAGMSRLYSVNIKCVMRYESNLHLGTLDKGSSDTLGQDLTTKSITIISVVAVHLPAGLKQVRRSNKAMNIRTMFTHSNEASLTSSRGKRQ